MEDLDDEEEQKKKQIEIKQKLEEQIEKQMNQKLEDLKSDFKQLDGPAQNVAIQQTKQQLS